VKVSGVFVVTGPAEAGLLGTSLPALQAQVDDLVVVANGPGSRPLDPPDGVRVVENDRALGFSANVNKGIAATGGEYVVIANPDAVPEPDCVRGLVSFADAHPRCGIAGPKMINPDGTLQASRRAFPTVGGTIVRRTMLDEIGGWDAGYKLYVEDIDLSYRAMKAGWERWWVPDAVVHHEYQAVIDKHFFTRRNLWHLHAMIRFLRKHPERLFALR